MLGGKSNCNMSNVKMSVVSVEGNTDKYADSVRLVDGCSGVEPGQWRCLLRPGEQLGKDARELAAENDQ